MRKMPVAAPTITSLFTHRDYLRLFTAQVSALFGTGLTTVALGLLAYELAGADAAAVLGTALTIKMMVYVTVAPIVAAYAHRFPRRLFLVGLNTIRAGVVLALPFIDQIWQIYVLIAVLQTASAAFTPTYQAVIPDILPDERDYTRALSAAQLAATMETLLSPMLAAAALSVISFHWLFVGTAVGFAISAVLVITTRIPDVGAITEGTFRDRIAVGMRIFAATPRLRGLLGLNLVVAAAGSVIMVNTVNYVRDTLGGTQSGVAMLLAANGFGTLIIALSLPRVIDRLGARPVMVAGAATLVVGLGSAVALSIADAGEWRWGAAVAVWAVVGAGTAAVLTPTGQVLRRSSQPADRPALFAAQFSLSHLAWLITYPIAGWLTTAAGFTTTWVTLAVIAGAGITVALRTWPRHDPAELTHLHEVGTIDPARLADAVRVAERLYQHTHEFVIDAEHRRWPTRAAGQPAMVG
ncbi:MFS transporter [Nocardia sp. GCM10030253]|uniref:MFS transporter n=1 Tax=Nocardia sp. GCM10030253 TaxID=3273404 RepID=UPI00363DFB67